MHRQCTVSTVCVVQVLRNGAKGSLRDASYWKTMLNLEGSSCHHTGNDCESECFSLGISAYEIHRLLDISVGTTHTIMRQHLNFRKICAQGAPHQLTTEPRNTRMVLSLSHLQRYHEEEYDFLSQIVTGDETRLVQTWIRQQPTSFFKDGIDPASVAMG
ncbi:histone-lysine N-methyltransferase SETMAR [Trichonephila clavipes]|nr:histone-lysine N-methyltransferase SETMAR [Trichonephila clavipes]